MRRWLRLLLRGLAVALLLLVALYLLRGPLLSGPVSRAIAEALSRELGGRVTIGSLSGNWITDAVLEDVSVELDGVEARFDRLVVEFDLIPFRIDTILTADAQVWIDLTRPTPQKPGDRATDDPDPFAVVADLPRLQASGTLRVKTDRGTLVASDVTAVATPGRGELAVGACVGGGRLTLKITRKGVFGTLEEVSFKPLAGGRASGTFGFDGKLRASVTVLGAHFDAYRADRVFVEGEWPRVRHLELRSGRSSIVGGDLVLDPKRPLFLASIGSLHAAVEDLRDYYVRLPVAVALDVDIESVDQRRVVVRNVVVRSGRSALRLGGTIDLPEDPEHWDRTRLHLEGIGELVDADWLVDLQGRLELRGEISGTLGRPRARFSAEGAGLSIRGRKVSRLVLDASLDADELTVEKLVLNSAPGTLEAHGIVSLKSRRVREGTYRADIKDLARFLHMFPAMPDAGGSLSGSGSFAVRESGLHGAGELKVENLVFDRFSMGDANIRLRAEENVLLIKELTATGPWGRLSTRGRMAVGSREIRLDSLEGAYRGRRFRQEKPLTLGWAGSIPRIVGLDAATRGGSIRGSVVWSAKPEIDVVARGIEISQLDARFTGFMDASIKVARETCRIDVTVPELAWREHFGSVRILVTQPPADGIEVERLDIRVGTALEVKGSAVLPWRLGREGFVRHDSKEPRLHLDARLAEVARFLGLAARSAELHVEARGDALSMKASAIDLVLDPGRAISIPGETRLDLTTSKQGAELSVETPRNEKGHASGALRTERGFDWTRPSEWKRAYRGAVVHGSVDLDLPDVAPLRVFAPEARYLAGAARVKLRFDGPWSRPGLDGYAELENISISIPGVLPPVEQGSGRVSFDRGSATIERFRGRLGYSPFELSGTVDLPDRVDLRLKGRNLLLMRRRPLRLRADVDLTLRGPLHDLLAAGSVTITDGLYSEPVSLFRRSAPTADDKIQLFSIRERPFRDLRFDITVRANESFRVRNNILRGVFSADLTLQGTGEVPIPVGQVYFRNTLIKWDFSSLKVDQGKIVFSRDQPFAPSLDASARTRIHGYDLSVIARGELPDVRLIVSSTPALSQEEAIILITTGATPAAIEAAGVGNVAASRAATYLGRRLVERVAGPTDPDSEDFLDRFSFEVGREVSRNRRETIEGEFRVTPRWYLRVQRDRWEDFNGGVVWRLRFR